WLDQTGLVHFNSQLPHTRVAEFLKLHRRFCLACSVTSRLHASLASLRTLSRRTDSFRSPPPVSITATTSLGFGMLRMAKVSLRSHTLVLGAISRRSWNI